jgi:hypothetical protein
MSEFKYLLEIPEIFCYHVAMSHERTKEFQHWIIGNTKEDVSMAMQYRRNDHQP